MLGLKNSLQPLKKIRSFLKTRYIVPSNWPLKSSTFWVCRFLRILSPLSEEQSKLLTCTYKSFSLAVISPFLVLITLSSPVTHGQGLEIAVPRKPPVIDGIIGQLEWSGARIIQVNIEVDPGDNIEAAVTAQALLMEDGEKIYVAFKAQDPDPGQIRGL